MEARLYDFPEIVHFAHTNKSAKIRKTQFPMPASLIQDTAQTKQPSDSISNTRDYRKNVCYSTGDENLEDMLASFARHVGRGKWYLSTYFTRVRQKVLQMPFESSTPSLCAGCL
jgi:hypothetical protein